MYRGWRTAGTVVAHPLAGLSAAGHWLCSCPAKPHSYVSLILTDLELVLGLLNHCSSGISTVFHPIWGFSPHLIAGAAPLLQGMHLIQMIQPLLFHWCQCLGKSPSPLIPLPTLRNISILPEVLLTCCSQISEAIAVSLLAGFLCYVAEALLLALQSRSL